jgi:hypothetical protein
MRPSSGVTGYTTAAKLCSVSTKRKNEVCEVLRGGLCTIIACACIRGRRVSLLVVGRPRRREGGGFWCVYLCV